ncbi:MAG: ABC-2 transporter permease [Lachnospiraceae bacterium]|nr:ABC-2 transporter permease [Lachnospiraceae bacterium]
MKGLLKNNLLAVYTNAKVFFVFMLLLGAFAVAVISQSLLIGYVMIGMLGFSYNAAAVVKNEFATKWGKYKLTLPVKRADIVKSLFLNHIVWILAGTFFSIIVVGLSLAVHGSSFDQPIDILSLFALGMSMSLFMGAVFFPLFYLGGEERSEVFQIISILVAFCLDFAIISAVNNLLAPGITAIVLGAVILLASSGLAFGLSYLLTAQIFRQKEY